MLIRDGEHEEALEQERGWFINLNKSERYDICGGKKYFGLRIEIWKCQGKILYPVYSFFLSILNYLHKRVQCIHDLPFIIWYNV